MDVNVKDTQLNKEVAKAAVPISRPPRQREIRALSISPVSVPVDTTTLTVKPRAKSDEQREMRARINDVISTINVAAEATSEIQNLVKSIEGITTQAGNEQISDERRAVLEKEARGLVDEIKKRASLPMRVGSNDESQVRLEIEQTLGKTLEALFPEGADNAFGIEAVSFTPKENIISVRTSIEVAQRRLQELALAIDNAKAEVKATIDTFEVASQNTEASDASIRDVDAALKLAAQTKSTIGTNPESALGSVGQIDKSAANLLGS
ncbi:MAG: hypothetical protein GX589_07365 [Deltaproteobacteria bacterium]|nr:hypothetical protein [Deltaproteobacteria bacterium]